MKSLNLIIILTGLLLANGCTNIQSANFFPAQNTIKNSNLDEADLKWMQFLGVSHLQTDNFLGLAKLQTGLLAADSRGMLRVLDNNSGLFTSTIKVNKAGIIAGPVVKGQYAVVITKDLKLVVVNLHTKAVKWSVALRSEVFSTPVIADNLLVLHSLDGTLIAYNLQDGTEVWNYVHTIPKLVLRKSSTPVVYGDSIIVGLSNGKLISVNKTTGALDWEYNLNTSLQDDINVGNLADICISPVIKNNVVYAAGYNSALVALDVKTGLLKWQKDISSYSGLVIANNKLIVVETKGDLYALNLHDGSTYWKQDFLIGRKLSSPVMYNNMLAMSDPAGVLHLVGAETGKVLKHISVYAKGTESQPIVIDNVLYVHAVNGCLVALNIHNKPSIKL